jgi:hypothetical protein
MVKITTKIKRYYMRALKHMKKRPLVAVLSVVAIVALLGVGSYQLFGVKFSQNANIDRKNEATKSVKDDSIKKSDQEITPVASPAPPEVKPDDKPVPQKTTPTAPSSTQGKGCAGCATPNPSFSIITTGSISVTAGSSVGPFTASTSNGSTVSWATPQYNGGIGPQGYMLSGSYSAPSLQYYIRAESNVAPGNYTLYMSAIHPGTQTNVKTTINVNVLPAPTYPGPLSP